MSRALACSSCGFETPRAFRSCARCGQALVDPLRRSGTRAGDTFGRMRLAPERTVPTATAPVFVSHEVTASREGPLVGRKKAVSAIQSSIERAFAFGAPTVVALTGPRGSGRTSLLYVASQRAARLDPRVRIDYGTFQEGRDAAYAPFSRILLDRFGVTPASVPSHVRNEMSAAISSALSATEVEALETTQLLGHVAGIPFPDEPLVRSIDHLGRELPRRAAEAVRRLYASDAARGPILLLLDNLDGADAAAWEVVREICRLEAPVAIVVAGGTEVGERARALAPLGGVSAVPLEPLDEREVAEVLSGLLPELVSPPSELVAALTHRSLGNPSALRELAFALWESGVFVRVGAELAVDVARLRDADMPVSMHDAVRARLARLDPLERATLDRAAVVGESFWDGSVLAQMRFEQPSPGSSKVPLSIWQDDFDADAIADALERLVEKGFLIPNDSSDLPGVREHRFALAGTRPLVYDEMDAEKRQRRHGIVARWLSVAAATRRDVLGALVAPHHELAGNATRAAQAYYEAAVFERIERRTARALQYTEKALSLVDADEVSLRLDVLHEHGSLLSTVGQYDRSVETFAEMLRLAWSIGARGKGGAALNRIARVHRERGENAKARESFGRALALFRSAHDLRGVASTLDDLAQLDLRDGRTDEATRSVLEALDIRRAHGDRRGEALSLTTLGRIELRRGQLAKAESLLRAGLSIRESVADDRGILGSLVTLGRLRFERGEREQALETWDKALSRARELADRRTECILLQNVAEGNLVAGRADVASEHLARAKEIAREIGDRLAATRIEILVGRLAMRRGEPNAKSLLESALSLAEAHGSKEALAYAHRYLGQWRALTVDDAAVRRSQTAEESFLLSIDCFREIGNEREGARSLMDLGHHLLERGDIESGRERLVEARAIMRRMGLPEAEHVSRVLSQLHA